MGRTAKAPKPEKNSPQYLRSLLNREKKEKDALERKLEQCEKYIEILKKDVAKLTGALEGRFPKEEMKELAAKMVKKREASLALKEKPKKQVLNPCPKCGEEMLILSKADGTKLCKCMKCRKKL